MCERFGVFFWGVKETIRLIAGDEVGLSGRSFCEVIQWGNGDFLGQSAKRLVCGNESSVFNGCR